jgi:hypothetical protein
LTLFEKAWTLADGNQKISSGRLFQSALVLFTKENFLKPFKTFKNILKHFKKSPLRRLLKMVENNGSLSNHLSSFRERHSTTEQTRRVVQKINEAIENKRYLPSAFLDIYKPSIKYGILNSYTI